jgi:serine/threonine-protein kinase Chk1
VPLGRTSPVVAVKFINKEHAFKQGRLTPKHVNTEILLHGYLGKHQNIIHQLGHGEDAIWTWIAMELAEGGDLFDKVEADEGVEEGIAHFYFTQLIGAVSFMHHKGIAHRDLKPENILLSMDGDLKLADFGLAALFKKDGKLRQCNSICGSPPYIAPEVVNGRKSKRADMLDSGYMANICDIWSCGVVLFVLLVGNTPWDEPTMNSWEYKEYFETGGRTSDELWQQIPSSVVSLLRGMLKVDPAERFTLEKIREHPWFTQQNAFMNSRGQNVNPVGMATQMLSQLRIDFSKPPTLSQGGLSQSSLDPDSMDIDTDIDMDSAPHRSRANPANINMFSSSTQPETPIADTPFDWERPPRLATHDGVSASQPATHDGKLPASTDASAHPTTFLSQLSNSTQDILSQDPSMTQFSATPSVPLTLTQQARQFKDVLPHYSLARFISPLTISLLTPLLIEALHRLGVPVPAASASAEEQQAEWERTGEASIRVKMADGRKQGLNGHIVVDTLWFDGVAMTEARFVKASGDPLEWRRFFKNVVVCVGDAVLRPG